MTYTQPRARSPACTHLHIRAPAVRGARRLYGPDRPCSGSDWPVQRNGGRRALHGPAGRVDVSTAQASPDRSSTARHPSPATSRPWRTTGSRESRLSLPWYAVAYRAPRPFPPLRAAISGQKGASSSSSPAMNACAGVNGGGGVDGFGATGSPDSPSSVSLGGHTSGWK